MRKFPLQHRFPVHPTAARHAECCVVTHPCPCLPGQVMGARSFKGPVLALLAANTAVTMTQTDGFLSTRLFNQFYSGFPTRMDAVISGGGLAGFLLLQKHACAAPHACLCANPRCKGMHAEQAGDSPSLMRKCTSSIPCRSSVAATVLRGVCNGMQALRWCHFLTS